MVRNQGVFHLYYHFLCVVRSQSFLAAYDSCTTKRSMNRRETDCFQLAGESRGSSARPSRHSTSASPDLFDLQSSGPTRKTPESFLGPNAALVNLDSLVTRPPQPTPISNPFLATAGAAPATAQVNPFQVNQPQPPTLNQMRVSPMMGLSGQGFGTHQMSAEPLPLSSLPPPASVTMVPMPGMMAMGHMMPGMSMGIPASMSMPMSTGLPPGGAGTAGQAGTTTNPFLL